MNIRQLQYFVQVVKEGSFTRAAKVCAVAQPSLSQQIQNLEAELGEPLLLRRREGVATTSAGETVFEKALEMLACHDDLLATFRAREEEKSGEISLGIIPTMATRLLPPLLKDFQAEYPRVRIQVREAKTSQLIRYVVDEDVDFAVLSDVEAAERSRWSLHVRTLYREPMLLAVPQDHRLVRRERSVDVAEIAAERLLTLSEGHCLRGQALQVCKADQPAEGVQCEQLPTLLALVAAGLGITFVPEMATKEHAIPGVKYLRLQHPEPTRAINVMRRKARKLGPAAANLLRLVSQLTM